MTKQDQIEIIANFAPRVRQQVDSLSDEQLTTAYIDGEWTIAQNIHHLFDAHTNAYQLFRRVLTEANAGLSWPDQDAVANLPDAKSGHLEPSLTGLAGLHQRWGNMLNDIQDWSKSGTSLKSGTVYSLEILLDMYANHCNNHVQQIQDVMDAMSD